MDNGALPILWIGHSKITQSQLAQNDAMRPVVLDKDAIGGGLPTRPLYVSRQHRLLLRAPETIEARRRRQSKGTQGQKAGEVLIAAKDFLALPNVQLDDLTPCVEYFHLLLPSHEIIFANGLPSESLYPGEMAQMIMMGYKMFPNVDPRTYAPARPFLRGAAARDMVDDVELSWMPNLLAAS
jgi:hypothetical protein